MARHFLPSGENNASRRSLAPRAAKVHCAIRPAWDSGTGSSRQHVCPPPPGRSQLTLCLSLSPSLSTNTAPHPKPFLALSGRPLACQPGRGPGCRLLTLVGGYQLALFSLGRLQPGSVECQSNGSASDKTAYRPALSAVST